MIFSTIIFVLVAIAVLFLYFPFGLIVLGFLKYKLLKQKFGKKKTNENFAVIVTAYKEIGVIVPLIQSLKNQTYQNFKTFIIADRCAESYPGELSKQFSVHFPIKPLDSKVRSLRKALQLINESTERFDYIVIMDPDNYATETFFESILKSHHSGYEIVQCRRLAANFDTKIACLDAAGENYKNMLERFAVFQLGSSCTIAGSGFSLNKKLFEDFMNSEEIARKINGVILGEDKLLQNHIVSTRRIIAFQHDNLVYDEKVSVFDQVKRQRTRWLATYFENFSHALVIMLKGITNLNWNQLLFGIITVYPPLILVLAYTMLMILICLFTGNYISIAIIVAGQLIFACGFLFAQRFFNAPSKLYNALFHLPLFVLGQFRALKNIPATKNDFLVTEKKIK